MIARRGSFALLLLATLCPPPAFAWHDETHLAIARAAGYAKWFNAAGADIVKVKAPTVEQTNHYVNNPFGTVVTADVVKAQVARYDTEEPTGHLYGAVLAAVRNYLAEKAKGKYSEYHLAFAAHYLGDLSMPLHNTPYDSFNEKQHAAVDGLVNDEVLANLGRLRIEKIRIGSEDDLAREVARLANASIALGQKIERDSRLPTKAEVYRQLGRSASLLRAVLKYTGAPRL